MPTDIVHGGRRLEGVVEIDRAKNAVLPILAATLLSPATTTLHDVPLIDDVDVLLRLMKIIGARIERSGHDIMVSLPTATTFEAPYYLTSRLRASFLLSGPLLGRFGRADMAMPGGCAIGSRPVDLHLKGFEAMGARVDLTQGMIRLRSEGLRGAEIHLDYPSVGATENLLMAATLAHGTTIITGAAVEPEVVDLASFLLAMGARIEGVGSHLLAIEGVPHLGGALFAPIPDRIEAGTYLLAGAATGGDVTVRGVVPDHLASVLAKLKESGCEIEVNGRDIRLRARERALATDIRTHPYPGFPTDLQAPFMALLCRGRGRSVIVETVFESRYNHVGELRRMGAHIRVDGRTAIVEGVDELEGVEVQARDLRGAAGLTLAALAAQGESEIRGAEYLDRGYRNIEAKLASLGADIERIA